MQSLSDIKALLESRGLSPKRSLGQNFLVDQNLLRKLIDSAAVAPGDLVLEVGPGTGVLTEELLARGCRVIACELDDSLAAMLAERARTGEIPGGERLTVVHADCLASKEQLSPLLIDALDAATGGVHAPGARFKLIANLPYGAATPLMMTLLTGYRACAMQCVTIQREVAERLLAKPRSSERGMLSVLAQAAAKVERIAAAPPECFWPRPDVTSAMVRLERLPEPLVDDLPGLAAFVKELFAHRRKQLGGVLKGMTAWPEGVAPTMRAEELSLEQVRDVFLLRARAGDAPEASSDPPGS